MARIQHYTNKEQAIGHCHNVGPVFSGPILFLMSLCLPLMFYTLVLFYSWWGSLSFILFFFTLFRFLHALSVAWGLIFGLQLTLLRLAFCFLTWLLLCLYLGPHLFASHNIINITVKDVSSLPVLNFSCEIKLQSGLMKLIISYYLVSTLWLQSRWTDTSGSVKYCMTHWQSPEFVLKQ